MVGLWTAGTVGNDALDPETDWPTRDYWEHRRPGSIHHKERRRSGGI